jgi:DNA-binding response OmpR family regulator
MKEKILIIEDEDEILDNLRILLNAEGFEIFSATDGQKGIALAVQHLPDLIVCDIMIPGFDGYEVLRKLKTDDKTNLIPFIFITAKAEPSDLRRGMELGADDFISKPFSSEELLSAIKTRLHKHKSLISKLSSEKIDFDQDDDDKKLSIEDSIFVSYHNDTIPVKIAKIKYITAQNQYSTIFLEDQRNYMIRKSLSTWEKILP